MDTNSIIIAIDGYSSCGKSTVAKALAKKLNITYVDTGAMYRAVTYFGMDNGIITPSAIDENKLVEKLADIHINFEYTKDFSKQITLLNGVDVEKQIRSLEVSNNVSPVSKIKAVRQKLVAMQRKMAGSQGVVMDGRDIGTVVLPNAHLKVFMTAEPDIRAKRRYDELIAKGENPVYDEVKENIIDRDYQDENRDESPLKKAEDAIVLDNSNLNQEEQLQWIVDKIASL